MNTIVLTLTFAAVTLTVAGGAAPPASRSLRSDEERKPYLEAEKNSTDFKDDAGGEAAGKSKMPVCSMVEYPAGDGKPAVVAILRYRYDDGATLRTKIDVATKKVLSVEKLTLYPTPLAGEEIAEAIRLARAKSPAVDKIYKEAANDPVLGYLVPIVSDSKNPKYGHRLVLLSVSPKAPADPEALPPRRVTVRVDLTNESVDNPK